MTYAVVSKTGFRATTHDPANIVLLLNTLAGQDRALATAYTGRDAKQPSALPPLVDGIPYEIAGKRFTVSDAVMTTLKRTSQQSGLPLDVLIEICARESDCAPNSINPSSKACGIKQFMVRKVHTLHEAIYRHAKDAGYPNAAKLVKRVNIAAKGEKPVWDYLPIENGADNGAKAQAEIEALCLDADFSLALWLRMFTPQVEKYNAWLGDRRIVGGEAVLLNNLGLGGLKLFVKQVWADSEKAKENQMTTVVFFKQNQRAFGGPVTSNRDLTHHKNGREMTVVEAYNSVVTRFGGWKPVLIAQRSASEHASADIN